MTSSVIFFEQKHVPLVQGSSSVNDTYFHLGMASSSTFMFSLFQENPP